MGVLIPGLNVGRGGRASARVAVCSHKENAVNISGTSSGVQRRVYSMRFFPKPDPEPFELRLATVADAGALAAMSRDLVETGLGWSWKRPRIIAHIRSPESVVLVAMSGRRLVGFAIMRFGDEEAHLDLLAVRPKYRRAGVGRRLVEWLEKSALVAGISVIYLEVREVNPEAQAFYRRLGYCRAARLAGYYQGQESAILMARDLWCTEPKTAA